MPLTARKHKQHKQSRIRVDTSDLTCTGEACTATCVMNCTTQPGGCDTAFKPTSSIATQAPLAASHTRRVVSSLPLASCLPPGLHTIEETIPECP
jgi:hypothetical protein